MWFASDPPRFHSERSTGPARSLTIIDNQAVIDSAFQSTGPARRATASFPILLKRL